MVGKAEIAAINLRPAISLAIPEMQPRATESSSLDESIGYFQMIRATVSRGKSETGTNIESSVERKKIAVKKFEQK